MGKSFRRLAMGVGVLLSGLLLWLSVGYRSVSRASFAAMLEARTAVLEARLRVPGRRDRAVEPDSARRIGSAVRAGMLVMLDPRGSGGRRPGVGAGMSYLGRVGGSFTAADRDVILGQPDVRAALGELERLEAKDWEIAIALDEAETHLTHACMLLALEVSQAVAKGQEDLAVTRFERSVQLAVDLLAHEDHEFGRLGMNALQVAITSAHQSSFVSDTFYSSAPPMDLVEESTAALLSVVVSEAGRGRLIAALAEAEPYLATPRDGLVWECQRSLRLMGKHVHRTHRRDESIPYRWRQDLGLLVDWQDGVLELIDDPAFVVSRAGLEAPMFRRRFLHRGARRAVESTWADVGFFSVIGRQFARVKSLIEQAAKR